VPSHEFNVAQHLCIRREKLLGTVERVRHVSHEGNDGAQHIRCLKWIGQKKIGKYTSNLGAQSGNWHAAFQTWTSQPQ
jgi:hypothetical protein